MPARPRKRETELSLRSNTYLFVRNDVLWDDGHVSPGVGAGLWSSRANLNAAFRVAFYFFFNTSSVSPSDDFANYWIGLPLRCLVR